MKTDVIAQKIANRILTRQEKIAAWLNRKTQHWNKASKLIALSAFLMAFGTLCLYLIIKAFNK